MSKKILKILPFMILCIVCSLFLVRQSTSAYSVGGDVSDSFTKICLTNSHTDWYNGEPLYTSFSISSMETSFSSYTEVTHLYGDEYVAWSCDSPGAGYSDGKCTTDIRASIISIDNENKKMRISVLAKYTGSQNVLGYIDVPIPSFNTYVSASIEGAANGVLYVGETVTPNLSIKLGKNGSSVGKDTPSDTKINVVDFYIDSDDVKLSADIVGGGSSISGINNVCDYFKGKLGNGLADCRVFGSEDGASTGGTITQDKGYTYNRSHWLENNEKRIGQKYCVAIGVSPTTDSDSNWNISHASCRTIAKKPTVQVKDGSVYSAAGIKTSISKKASGTFGSWVEYLAIADSDEIKNFSSGAYLNSNNNTDACEISPLTIANNDCKNSTNTLGKSGILPPSTFIDSLIAQYPVDNGSSSTTCIGTKEANGHTTTCKNAQKINIDSITTYPAVFHTSGNIYITSDIKVYNEKYSSVDKIPQVVIISGGSEGFINIFSRVSRVDAVLVAPNGIVDTCATIGSTEVASNLCKTQLTINGAIYAKKIELERTAGMDNDPAEIIAQTPLIYLWARAQQTSSSNIQANTVYTKELAPRL